MRFTVAEAGDMWVGSEPLAVACEVASLSVDQAEAVRLTARGHLPAAVAYRLSLLRAEPPRNRSVKHLLRDAERRLKRTHPHLLAIQRRVMIDLLASFRNVRPTNPNVAIYRERCGVHDTEPVRFRSRLTGEVADDLMREPRRFLKDLPELLRLHAEAERDAVHAAA